MRALLVLPGLLCAAAAAAPRASIELLPVARVHGESVVLGQVAHLSSTDLALVRLLVNLPIGRAPRAGEPAVVRKEMLASWIHGRAGLDEGALEWRGAAGTRVERAVREVKGVEVAAIAVQALRAWMAERGEEAGVHATTLPRDLQAPAGEVRLQARALGFAQLRSRMVVWVDVWSDAAWVRSLAVSLEVVKAAPTDRPARPLEAPLQLRAEAPAALPLVTRGAWATLRSAAGVVTLESRVEVLQDGRAGERVRVRQPGATGVVFARVTGPAQLELVP